MDDYHGGSGSIRPKSKMISKIRTFKTASCLARYLVCASAGHADKMWAMPYGAVPHSLHAQTCLMDDVQPCG